MEYLIVRFLDTNGDGTGTINANGDYSSAADIFYIQPPANKTYNIFRLIITIEDTSGMQAAEYGNLGAALANGVTIRAQNDAGTIANFTPVPITNNALWGAYCYDVDLKTWGAGNEFIVVRWTFANTGRIPTLNGSNNERLEVVLNDNLTGLVSHYFMVQGNLI